MDTARRTPREVARWVLDIEARAIDGLLPQLDESFDRAVELLRGCSEVKGGRVVCTGMGKSGIVMKKVAATMASTISSGIVSPSLFWASILRVSAFQTHSSSICEGASTKSSSVAMPEKRIHSTLPENR